jgi:plasmid stabilization system protein ParE
MDCQIILSTEYIKEIEESFQWYENRSSGLGAKFIEVIDKTINLIMLNPEGYPQKTSPYREIAFMKFPYIIVYEFIKEENIVYILHVFHSKRSPLKKYGR